MEKSENPSTTRITTTRRRTIYATQLSRQDAERIMLKNVTWTKPLSIERMTIKKLMKHNRVECPKLGETLVNIVQYYEQSHGR